MDTTALGKYIGIPRKDVTRWLRRVERGLGVWQPNVRRTFTEKQAEELRLAYHQGANKRQ
jgi:predicted DNA binding protein